MIVECPRCHLRYDVSGRPPNTSARCRCGEVFTLPTQSRQAGLLKCPQCAAPSDPKRSSCQHCETPLRVKACPRCFAQMFAGCKHCDQCGAEVSRAAAATADGSARARQCPRCPSRPLVARLVADAMLDGCFECGGLFVDTLTLERIVLERHQGCAIEIIGAAKAAVGLGPSGYVRCPVCDDVMSRQNFGRNSGVMVDVCRPHGTWFDSTELCKVVEFIAAGRLTLEEIAKLEQMSYEATRDADGHQTQATITPLMVGQPTGKWQPPKPATAKITESLIDLFRGLARSGDKSKS